MSRWIAFGILSLVAAGTAGRVSASFVVSPMEHHLSVAPGSQGAASVTIHNTGTKPLTVRLYLQDSNFDARGTETDVSAGKTPRSCASWIASMDAVLDFAAGEVRTVILHVSVPDSASGSYWTKLYIEEMSNPIPHRQQVNGRSYAILLRQQIGVRIFCDAAGTEIRNATVDWMNVKQDSTGGRSVEVRIVNTGNALLHCQGRIEVRDDHGQTVESLKVGQDGEFYVFPGSYRELNVKSTQTLPPATYTSLAVVDFGGDHVVAGEEVFQIGKDGAVAESTAGSTNP